AHQRNGAGNPAADGGAQLVHGDRGEDAAGPMRGSSLLTALAAGALLWPAAPQRASGPHRALPIVHANDNRTAAGRMRGDTLAREVVVGRDTWRPEADSGPSRVVAAFGEAGRDPEIPGPLIRVPTGAVITATVANRLSDSTITVHGLFTHAAGAG